MKSSYDLIIIGAGAMGSAGAYYAAKMGARVLLLEQFGLDHQMGSSYGSSRIIRYSYNDGAYVRLAKDTYPLWEALEAESGVSLLQKTGGVDFGREDEPTLQESIAALQQSGIAHEMLSPEEAHYRFRQFRFAEGMQVMYQPDTGFLRASLAVKTHVAQAQKHGAILQTEEAIKTIKLHEDHVAVKSTKGTYTADRVLITAGAWARDLIRMATGDDLPLVPWRAQLVFYEPSPMMAAQHRSENMPCFIFHRGRAIHHVVYGIPAHDEFGVKAAFHGGQAFAHPDAIDRHPDADEAERVRATIGPLIPALQRAAIQSARVCLYTITPDDHFIIDRHPAHPRLTVGAGFSGHGFKFSTLVGKMLAELALDGATAHERNLFGLARFL